MKKDIWEKDFSMKIYMFIALMGIGGAERVCVSLANEFAAAGYEPHIVVLNLKNDVNTHLLDSRCRVHELGVSRLRYAAPAMVRFMHKHRPESILVFGNEMGIILNTLRKFKLIQVKIILRVLNNVNISFSKEEHVSKTVEKYLKKQQKQLKDMEHVVAQCQAMRDMILDRELVSDEKITAIYNPVSEKIVQAVEKLPREEKEGYQFTFIGRLDPQKNLPHLLSAFKLVLEKRQDVSLHLVGDGILKEQLQEEACRLNIDKHVFFEGMRKDIEHVYCASDVVVLSSEYEGMPNCLIEAIACGIPVVSYDCPIGPKEIIVDDVNGYLVSFMNVDELAQKMLLAVEKEWQPENIKKTAEKFRAAVVAKQYLKVLGLGRK